MLCHSHKDISIKHTEQQTNSERTNHLEAPEACYDAAGGRYPRKGTFRCQSLLLKQIGNRRLSYCTKHLLLMYCDLESRRNCSIIVTADEKQLASI